MSEKPRIASHFSGRDRGDIHFPRRVLESHGTSSRRTESGWPALFRILRLYLTHFRGRRSAMTQFLAPAPGTEAVAWEKLTATLGLSGASVGQEWRAPSGVPALAGVVEYFSDKPCSVLVPLDQPGPGAAALGAVTFGRSVMVTLSFYFYGDRAAELVERVTPVWESWVQERYPALEE